MATAIVPLSHIPATHDTNFITMQLAQLDKLDILEKQVSINHFQTSIKYTQDEVDNIKSELETYIGMRTLT